MFIFAGLIFSGHLFYLKDILKSTLAFCIFCFLTGAVYIYNDITDIEQDRLHPTKSKRPIASAEISNSQAVFLFMIILSVFVPIAFVLEFNFGLVSVAYLLLNVIYSLKLKSLVIIDIFSVALGFVLRVIAGIVIINVNVTPWIVITTLFLALFIVSTKRRMEKDVLKDQEGEIKGVSDIYSICLLDILIIITSTVTIVMYSLFTFTAGRNINLMWTILFVIYGIFRYLYLIYVKNEVEEPSILIVKDKPLFLDCVLWVGCCIFTIYII